MYTWSLGCRLANSSEPWFFDEHDSFVHSLDDDDNDNDNDNQQQQQQQQQQHK